VVETGVVGPQVPAHTTIEISGSPFGGELNFEALPVPKKSQKTWHLPGLMGGSWLNDNQTPGPLPAGYTVWSDSGPNVCSEDDTVDAWAQNWLNNTTSYFVAFQNSNSYAWWLLFNANVEIPPSKYLFLSLTAPGWGWIPIGQPLQ
jgi:hypothetical protein